MSNNQEHDPQDMITRIVYIVRAKPEMLEVLRSHIDQEDLDVLSKPNVVMTEEAPFEQYFETWHRQIIKSSKIQFLETELEYGVLSNPKLTLILNMDTSDLETCFNKWWDIEKVEDYLEIESRWLKHDA